MTIILSVTPQWETDATSIAVIGPDEAAVVNVLVSRLAENDYDVQIEDSDGELLPFDQWEGDEDGQA